MKAQHQISEDDYAEMARLAVWRSFIERRRLTINAIVVILLVVGAIALPGIAPYVALFLAVTALFLMIIIFLNAPWLARRQYRQYKAIHEPITVELSDDGLRFSSIDGESIVPWSKVFQWRQNARFILIYKMPVMYHMVPKSLARDGFDIGLVIKRLTEHVGPER